MNTQQINVNESVLLLVDIQNDYFPGGKHTLKDAVSASQQARQLLGYFRDSGLGVVHIQHISSNADRGFFIRDTDGVGIHESVTPGSDEPVIIKHFPSSFQETGLEDILNQLGHKTLLIAGMQTNVCVASTARAAEKLGFIPVIVGDTTAAVSNELKEATLEELSEQFTVVSVDDII